MIPRLYLPQPLAVGDLLPLAEAQRHYLLNVMRLKAGEDVILFNGDGPEWQAVLQQQGGSWRLRLLTCHNVQRDSPLAVTLVQGLAKGPALDYVVQKGVELGMAAYIPLVCQRSRHDGGNRERWGRIAAEAAEQCGRTTVPTLHSPTPWEKLAPLLPAGPRWLLWEEEAGRLDWKTLCQEMARPTALTLLVGPEGGFEAREVEWARQHLGCQIVGLGPRILRTETAALAALTAVQWMWGDLA